MMYENNEHYCSMDSCNNGINDCFDYAGFVFTNSV